MVVQGKTTHWGQSMPNTPGRIGIAWNNTRASCLDLVVLSLVELSCGHGEQQTQTGRTKGSAMVALSSGKQTVVAVAGSE